MSLSSKKLFLLPLLLTFTAIIWGQSLNIPMVKTDHAVNSLTWSMDSQLFAYTDGSDIIIRRTQDYNIRQTINTKYKNILKIKFVTPVFDNPEDDEYYLLVVTDTNIIEIRELTVLDDDIGNRTYASDLIYTLNGNTEVKACSFTSTNDLRFIAVGYEDGSFSLYNFNSITNEYIEESYEIGETPLTCIDISTDQNMLLTCTENGIIYIWNNRMEELATFSYDFETLQEVYFNDNPDYPIICALDEYTITNFDLEAHTNEKNNIITEEPFKDFFVSVDRKTALLLGYDNVLNVYDLESPHFIGFIPSFSSSPITHFEIDSSQTKFLIAHEDNTIFILEINKVLFPKNAAIPNPKIVHMDSPDAMDELLSYEEEPPQDLENPDAVEVTEEQTEEEGHKYEALAMIRYKNSDAVQFRLKGSVTPGPYILSTSFSAGYIAYKLIQPFYFGGFIEPHIGFPQKDFPYKYEQHGQPISNPLIVGGKVYAPFGICVFPFQKNIEFFADIAPGIAFNMLWNSKFGDDAITSKLYTGFYAALRTGATYKNFSVYIEGNFDAILGFGFSIGISYSISISYERRIEEVKSLEEE